MVLCLVEQVLERVTANRNTTHGQWQEVAAVNLTVTEVVLWMCEADVPPLVSDDGVVTVQQQFSHSLHTYDSHNCAHVKVKWER